MDVKEKILSFINSKGPVLPRDILKEFKLSLTFAGAYLSELSSNKKLNISSAKIGGSPIYYLDSQKHIIDKYLYSHLNDKEKKAFDLIKEFKVLSDAEQDAVIKVALRNLKDFAVPLYVNLKSSREIYWKWHLISNEEVEEILRKKFDSLEEKTTPKDSNTNVPKDESKDADSNITLKTSTSDAITAKSDELISNNTSQTNSAPIIKTQTKNEISEKTDDDNSKTDIEETSLSKDSKLLNKDTTKLKKTLPDSKTTIKEKFMEIPKPTETTKELSDYENVLESLKETDSFLKDISLYFDNKGISILNFDIVKKCSEINLTILLPTSLGNLKFYCKAKNKKRCNEGDLSTAFVQGELKKLPVLFLTSGDLTKKAKDILTKDFKNMLIARLEE